MITSTARPTLLCFGEVLWDCLPAGLFLGGAPCNVAYHLHRLGCRALPVTAVGDDFLGQEILRRLSGWGIETALIAVISDYPTGTVQVTLTGNGMPSYTIVEDVAWDRIDTTSGVSMAAAKTADAIVFGSLCLRGEHNREALDRLMEPRSGIRVLDINLRPPFIAPQVLDFALRRTDLLKLNDDELAQLTNNAGSGHVLSPSSLHSLASAMSDRYAIPRICVTAGARGAGLFADGRWCWEDARPVIVADTVGAGDAFLAGLLSNLLRGEPGDVALVQACRLGELVASSVGATPNYDPSIL